MLARFNQEILFRVADANLNRAKEGLRVCEDVARFVWQNRTLTADYKKVRHGLLIAAGGFGIKELVDARDVRRDVGKITIDAESDRLSIDDIFCANSQRVKESLRVLEEFAKLMDIKTAEQFKLLRYRVYSLEKRAFICFQALSDS